MDKVASCQLSVVSNKVVSRQKQGESQESRVKSQKSLPPHQAGFSKSPSFPLCKRGMKGGFSSPFCLLFALCSLLFAICCFAEVSKEEADALLTAKRAFEDGFYDISATLFNRFISKFPSSALREEVNLYIGQCYFYKKKYKEAIREFNKLVELNEESDKIYYWLAEAYLKDGDFDKAYVLYEKVFLKYPASVYATHSFYSLGWVRFEQGRFNEAKEKFLQFKNKFPEDLLAEDAAFKVAECLYNLKDYQKLKSYVEEFSQERYKKNKDLSHLDIDAKSALLKFYLAESCFYLEDYGCAIDNYSKALNQSQDYSISNLSFLGLGWSYLKSNNFAEAKASFDKALKGQSDKKSLESALLGKTLSLQMESLFKESLDSSIELIGLAESPEIIFEAYLCKAEALYNLENYLEAISAYKEAKGHIVKEIAESSLDRLDYGLGLSYLKAGKFNEAQEIFYLLLGRTKAAKIKISGLSRIGDAYLELGKPREAIAAYENILKDYPQNNVEDYVQNQIAIALLNSKRYPEAIDLFKKVIRNYPKSRLIETAEFYLGTAYYESENFLDCYLELRNFTAKYPKSEFYTQALFLEAFSLKSLSRFQEACDIFKEILKGYSNNSYLVARTEFEIGDCLYYLGRKEEALEKFESLRSKYNEGEVRSLVLWRLSEYYFHENKLDLAKRYLLSFIYDSPNSPLLDDAYYMLALSYEQEGKYDEALEAFKKVKVRTEEAYPKIAEIYKHLKKFQEAIYYYRLTLKGKDADKPKIRFNLGEVLEEAGMFDEAIVEYSSINSNEDKLLAVKGLLRCGNLFENQKRWVEAIKVYEKITSLVVEESKFAKERIDTISEQYLAKKNKF